MQRRLGQRISLSLCLIAQSNASGPLAVSCPGSYSGLGPSLVQRPALLQQTSLILSRVSKLIG